MADTENNGRDELFYVLASDPGNEAATRLPSNYVLAGNVLTSNLSLSNNLIAADHKDSGLGSNDVTGRLSGSHSLSYARPSDDNTGLAIIRDDGIITKTLIYCLRVAAVARRAVHFAAYVESYEESDDDEALSVGSCTFKIQGVPTFFLRGT